MATCDILTHSSQIPCRITETMFSVFRKNLIITVTTPKLYKHKNPQLAWNPMHDLTHSFLKQNQKAGVYLHNVVTFIICRKLFHILGILYVIFFSRNVHKFFSKWIFQFHICNWERYGSIKQRNGKTYFEYYFPLQ